VKINGTIKVVESFFNEVSIQSIFARAEQQI